MQTSDQILQKGRFTVIRPLGQNGLGVAYEAFDNESDRTVLLKEIPETLHKVTTISQIESRKQAFAEKAETLFRLKHQGLLPPDEYFSEINHHYLVMSHTEGSTLDVLLERNDGAVASEDAGKWTLSLLEALGYLHTRTPPVYHLDVRPGNIFLNAGGEVKLFTHNIIEHSDLKRYVISEDEQFDSAHLPFSPLEQVWEGLDSASQNVIFNSFDERSQKILQKPFDARTDLYALGATIYYLITARLPFDPLTRLLDILDGRRDPLTPPHEINPAISKGFSRALMRALELKREDRFDSANAMRQAIDAALSGPAEESPAPAEQPSAPAAVPAVRFEDEEKRQLEVLKKQLREAEERRLAAEQRAAEAEKLLLAREETPEAPAGPFQNGAEPPAAFDEPVGEPDGFETVRDEPDPEEPAGSGRTLVKAVGGGLAVLVLAFGGWGIWSFYGKAPGPAGSLANERLVPPVSAVRNDSGQTAPESDDNAEETEAEPTAETPSAATDAVNETTQSAPARNTRTPARPVVKTSAPVRRPETEPPPAAETKPENTKPANAKPANTRPAPSKKSSVTLDDLLEDN